MIAVTTYKDEDDGLLHVESWEAISKAQQKDKSKPTVYFFIDRDVDRDFYKNYFNYYVRDGFLRKLPNV